MIELKNIRFSYSPEKPPVLDGFDAVFYKHKISCVLAPSGAGKTTLLNILAGLLKPEAGEITGAPQNISYVFQADRLLPHMTSEKNLDFILKAAIKDKKERAGIIKYYLNMLEIEGAAKLYPHELSGGMAKRLSLARAFAYPSDLLLMDEPFTGLDIRLKDNIIKQFAALWERDRRTVIFVTHSAEEAALLGDFIYVYGGKPLKLLTQSECLAPKLTRKLYEKDVADVQKAVYRAAEKWV